MRVYFRCGKKKLFYFIFREGLKTCVLRPEISRVCPLSHQRGSFATGSGARPRNSHRCVRACLPCGHTLTAPPTCSYYLNESIKPPSNYLSYTERAYGNERCSPRRGQTESRYRGIIRSRAFCPSSELSTRRNLSPRPSRSFSHFSHTFFSHFSPFIPPFDLARAAPITAYFRAFEKRDRDSLICDCLKIIKPVKKKPRKIERIGFHELRNPQLGEWVHRGRSPRTISRVLNMWKKWFNENHAVMWIRLCISKVKEINSSQSLSQGKRNKETVINCSKISLFLGFFLSSLLSFFLPR